MISSLAAHFIESGLPANSVIAVQLPNTIEFALTVLAAFRAGLVVAVLPLLWRQSELTMALNRTAARAIVTCRQDRRRHLFRHRHERRRRGVLDPPCLRLRQRPARRHGLARQRDFPGIPDHARRDPGRPQGGADFLRRHLGRLPAGAARPSRPDCRRPCDVARKRRAAGRNHPVGVLADVVCRPRLVAGGLAAVGRNAGAAPSVRRGGAGAADQRAGLRYADCTGATGAAAGRDGPRRADAEPAQCHRPVAHAGTGRLQRVLGRANRRR